VTRKNGRKVCNIKHKPRTWSSYDFLECSTYCATYISYRNFLLAGLQDVIFDRRNLAACSRVFLSVDNAAPRWPAQQPIPLNAKNLLPSTINTAIMCFFPTSTRFCQLCYRSETVLASRDRITPSVLPASLLEHPIWKHLTTQEGSAYERNCTVADVHK
jgi:hypothetical protein